MTMYKKTQIQFDKFIKSQKGENLTTYEIKLINLIRDNFENVANLGTAQGYRAHYINELININRSTIKDELLINDKDETVDKTPFERLHSLDVKNFRGFKTKENFSFDRLKILVYGPNGSGKTSFCEALEYALLGYLSEADSKRISNDVYITNAYTRTFTIPALKGQTKKGDIIEVIPNPDIFYFCFIEKNRIVDFARYSAKTESKQTNLLATLFGLDEFYSFIAGFTNNITGKIPIESEMQKELDKKKLEVGIDNKNIETAKEKIKGLETEKLKIVEDSKLEKTFEELNLYINGDEANNIKGRIDLIDEELQKQLPKTYTFNLTQELQSNITFIEAIIQKFIELNIKYQNKKDKIIFKKMFEAVNELELLITDKCPVCETPINETKINPYINAKNKLNDLADIVLIEQERNTYWESVISEVLNFIDLFEQRKKAALDFNKVIPIDIRPSSELRKFIIDDNELYISIVLELFESIFKQKELLLELDIEFTKANEKAEKLSEIRIDLNEEKSALRIIQREIDSIKSQATTYNGIIEDAKKAIDLFDETNKELIISVETEKPILEENKKYIEAYNSLIQKLDSYKKELPISLVGNLNELTKEFYNFINQDDENFELLEKIDLPSKAGERINIWFQSAPENILDAMHILSEGHTRCLGVSILLAKVVQDELPFIIFDDVINAIDDTHRGRIRELLFEHEKLKEKQIIITSHSEEYIKDIENKHISKTEYDQQCRLYILLRPSKTTIIKKESTKNYLNKAAIYFEDNSFRDSLMESRRALENLTSQLWKKVGEKYNILLKVAVRTPNAPPELMSIIIALREKLRTLNDEKFATCLSILNWFEGLETYNNQIWKYLNKGTHEETDRIDFDEGIVNEIITNLISLETEIKLIGKK